MSVRYRTALLRRVVPALLVTYRDFVAKVSNIDQFPMYESGNLLLSYMACNVTVGRPARGQSNQGTILCVEDNAAYLQLRKAVLEKEGYLVLTATTGSRAVAVMQRVPVSLVLSDHMLRGTTGVALAQQLKAIKPHVPFVLYSGTVPEVMGNVDCFISKDETVPNFLSIIKSLIQRHAA